MGADNLGHTVAELKLGLLVEVARSHQIAGTPSSFARWAVAGAATACVKGIANSKGRNDLRHDGIGGAAAESSTSKTSEVDSQLLLTQLTWVLIVVGLAQH